ncbi:hypothetical protein DE146DRAFT_754067 [Phaeosphaeria sp. MPI-PUGE-AT-0046c]|nr:hypothetical protein DE146DRAFT_754067 [Phaeosphaeria sp. MPI-PUGE-AT-0046c]
MITIFLLPVATALLLDTAISMAALPTAWLAPPDNIVTSRYSTSIAPIPITISATIALIVGTAVLALFNRKEKDIFLDDRIPDVAETTARTVIPDATSNNLPPARKGIPPIQRPLSIYAKPIKRHSSFENQPKLDAVLGLKVNWDSEHSIQTPRSPMIRPSYFAPSHVDCVFDMDTLKDDEKNSAYVPYPSSEASDDTHEYGHSGLGRAQHLSVLDGESVFRPSPLSHDSRTDLGDAY